MEFGFTQACAAVAVITAIWAGHSARRSARSAEKALERANLIPEVTLQKDVPWPGWNMITIDMLNPGPATTVVTGISTPSYWLPGRQRARFLPHENLPRETVTTTHYNEYTRQTYDKTGERWQDTPPTDPGKHAIAGLNLRIPRSGARPLRLALAIPASSPLPSHLELTTHWADQRNQPKIIKVFVL